MAKIITETKVEECRKWNHAHKRVSGLVKGILYASNYCPECGEYLKENRPVTSRKCSDCGEHLLLADFGFKYKFCPKCGAKFED